MTKRMLIDATHAEETRVVVTDGNKIEDFDIETSGRKQLKGNIYLAKVVRVEPSLQAAFVEYGGGRHGFLAFGEIHPDYYQLPVADRQRLIALQEEEAREEDAREEGTRDEAGQDSRRSPATDIVEAPQAEAADTDPDAPALEPAVLATVEAALVEGIEADAGDAQPMLMAQARVLDGSEGSDLAPELADSEGPGDTFGDREGVPQEPPPEQIGGEDAVSDQGEERERRASPRFLRNYKIQEVVRRRQILLVQVVKEERGTKGAALTTYISLAGRFSVLMPNSPRGGGISRKITSAADRRRLKEVTQELDLPRGMGLIVRTAGANRPKPEILRDGEYLLNQWDQIRETTLASVAPALIYEEANLVKRSIRDLFGSSVEDITVDGEAGWKAARDYMRMLMPSATGKVKLWREPQPLFAKQGVEAQLDAMLSPNVQLRSGGYLVINQTEALVAVDVNSGRSTKERNIEETALRTNLEAAEEVARQLRLRDLAGLIVIDFIDMESRRNNAQVERRLKESLKNDRARIQVGTISHFGLMEMSRQRLRPSIGETAFTPCAACGGTGLVRSTESAALQVLRGIEEEGAKRKAAEILAHVNGGTALYLLNHKRVRLGEIEQRHGMRVSFASDDHLGPAELRVERLSAWVESEAPAPLAYPEPDELETAAGIEEFAEVLPAALVDDELDEPVSAHVQLQAGGERAAGGTDSEEGRRRKRRRRGRGRREDGGDAAEMAAGEAGMVQEAGDEAAPQGDGAAPPDGMAALDALPLIDLPYEEEEAEVTAPVVAEALDEAPAEAEGSPVEAGEEAVGDTAGEAKRRRNRRGGRRRRRDEDGAPAGDAETPVEAPQAWTGPTPADPFGGLQALDIFDVLERHEDMAPAPEPAQPIAATPEPEPVPEHDLEAGLQAALEAGAMPDTVSDTVPEVSVVAEEPPAPVMAEPVAAAATAPGAEPDAAPVQENLAVVAPVVIGSDEPPARRRAGWWRRG